MYIIIFIHHFFWAKKSPKLYTIFIFPIFPTIFFPSKKPPYVVCLQEPTPTPAAPAPLAPASPAGRRGSMLSEVTEGTDDEQLDHWKEYEKIYRWWSIYLQNIYILYIYIR